VVVWSKTMTDNLTMNPNPKMHPGQSCTIDCAEYGCAKWTGGDREARKVAAVAAERDTTAEIDRLLENA
jgi:hypothetical protein